MSNPEINRLAFDLKQQYQDRIEDD